MKSFKLINYIILIYGFINKKIKDNLVFVFLLKLSPSFNLNSNLKKMNFRKGNEVKSLTLPLHIFLKNHIQTK